MGMILNNYGLRGLNTFHLDVYCNYFTEISSEKDFYSLMKEAVYSQNEKLIIGGGSNILFTKNFEGLVIKNSIKCIELVKEESDFVYLRAGAGENWHQFVLHCIGLGYGGLENLSLIPGCVGASPMQNIGAYGVEIKDVFESLEAIDLITGDKKIFNAAECEFGYRESVFKRKFKNRYLIVNVVFRLSKYPKFNTSYGAIEQELERHGVKEISLKAVSDAVIRIRSSKLPDPAVLGNAGSFFKNPEVSAEKYNDLKVKFPNLVAYPLDNGNFKLAAGWLIEHAGWKGKRIKDAGVSAAQALVLVNYGNAAGSELYDLSQQVMDAVLECFGVRLEREVNIY
jgi:UDP-N-acetylmuramate dehydrogenase